MMSGVFKTGQRVKCTSTSNTVRFNRRHIEVGKIYTVNHVEGYIDHLSLKEVDRDTTTTWFSAHDFEPHNETDDAWNRAMGIL